MKITETFREYQITAQPVKTNSGKWAVCAVLERDLSGERKSEIFYAHDGIHYILEIEAAKEGINLGKNLIKGNLVGF